MARDQKVKVRIQAKDDASREVQKVEKGFGRLTSAVKANAAAIASAVAAVYGMVRVLGSLARAAFDSENAVRKMEAAMKTAGDFSKAASEDMQAFAKGLQSIGTESDESILAMVALAKGFVGTNEEAKKLVATALDFKEIAGLAFEESVRRIGRATGGSTEDIAKFDRRILDLTRTELANGEATRLLGEKYKGLNRAMSETAEGGLTKLENVLNDIVAAYGSGALSASGFSESIGDLTSTLEGQVGFFERLGVVSAIYFAELVKGEGHARAAATALLEVNDALDKSEEANSAAAAAAEKKAAADKKAADVAKVSKADQDALTAALKAQADMYTAAVESASAFGEVTSVQLEGQILAIITALHDQKVILGESSVEYQRLADAAGKKIESLKTRIESLRGGLGDLKDTTGEAADGMDTLGTAAEGAGTAAEKLRDGFREAKAEIEAAGRAAITTTGQFDKMAAAAGNAAAVAAAIEGGGKLLLGGTRIRLPRGGSRLTSEPGIGGRHFNPEQRSVVNPDGSVTFL